MKTENDFNAFLGKELRLLQKPPAWTFYMKAADKFRSGVSDFLIFHARTTLALENKFIREWPGDNVLLLSHEFDGTQQTFLESVSLSGNRAFGLVGVGSEKAMYAIHWSYIPKKGNWKTREFKEAHTIRYGFDEVSRMLMELTG